jgi:outer membrane receptor protein involved in Fe transport
MSAVRQAIVLVVFAASAAPGPATGAGVPAVELTEIVVRAQRLRLIGEVESASQGTVLAEQFENRPVLRPGEVLEVVPGLVVTQHSGDGKANQYFLRGFNLDHGTDFATRVDGIPVNMPTHAHGQGYTDLNFLIPEFVERVEYRKGTYYADQGNFSAAGAADIRYRPRLDASFAQLHLGSHDYRRAVLGASPEVAGGVLLLGGEYFGNDGPWTLEQRLRKSNALVKYTRGDETDGYALTAMAYDARWRSTDQIPRRAVEDGRLGRFDAVDPTAGGESSRYSLSIDGRRPAGGGALDWNAYAMAYDLDLWSNFTYAIDEQNGDQFEQRDRRRVYGAAAAYENPVTLLGVEGTFRTGAELRYDDIDPVGLYLTVARERRETVREDRVEQASVGAYASQSLQFTPWLRADAGLRVDRFRFDVRSSLAANSGRRDDTILSPKLTLALGPWRETEVFVNAGRGFHSNDARGTTIRVDPVDGVTPVEPVDPLVRAFGAEVGVRTAAIRGLQLAASVWTLRLDSELLFVGDGGATEPSRASRRDGFEVGAYFAPLDYVLLDADLAWTRARYTEYDPAGDRIPNAVESVVSVGLTINRESGWYGGARLRYFGPAPLIEDDSVRSSSTLLVNVEAGYHFTPRVSASLTVFNVFDRDDNDITYFYESRLPGEAEPVGDVHFHPVEPRTVRATLAVKF